MKKILIMSAVILMLTTSVFSRTGGGGLYGKIIQPNGSAAPGILVTLSSETGELITTQSSAQGNFHFIDLAPDTYQVKFEKTGYKTVIYKGVRLFPGRSKTLEIQMQVGAAAPPVVITEGSGAVDTRSPAKITNITREMLQSLPTGRNPWAIFNLAAGILLDREEVGGSKSSQQSIIVPPGARNTDVTWNMDGAFVGDVRALGGAVAYFNTNSFEEIQVTTAANDITSQTGGTQLNFISRRGGNRLSGDIYIYAENDAYEMTHTLPQSMIDKGWEPGGILRLYQYGANLGGPILKDKLWFYGSYGIQDVNCPTATGDWRDDTWIENMAAKIDFRFGNMSGFLRYSDDSKRKLDRFYQWPGDVQQDYTRRLHQDGHTKLLIGSLQQDLGNLMLNEKISYIDSGFTLEPFHCDLNPATGHLEGMDMYEYSLPTPFKGGSDLYTTVARKSLSLSLDGSYFIEGALGGDHEIRFGVDYRDAGSCSQSLYPNQRTIYIHDRNQPSGYKQIWWINDSIVDTGAKALSFYLADVISFGNLTAGLGLRYDKETNSHNPVTLPALTFNGTPIFTDYMGPLTIPAKNIDAAFTVFSPRISLCYDITGNGENVLKASFARYGSFCGYNFADFLWPIKWFREIDVDWNDYDNDLVIDWGEWSENPADWQWSNIDPANPGNTTSSYKIDPDYNSPLLTEITLSFEKAIAEDFSLALNAYYKKSTNLTRDIGLFSDTGALDSAANWYSGGVYTFTDGSSKEYYLRYANPDARFRTNYGSGTYDEYKALEFVLSRKLAHGWMLEASFTYSDWKSHYDPAEYFDKTNFDFFDGGCFSIQSGDAALSRVYMNARWQLEIAGLVQLPLGFNVSGVFRAREGFLNPFYEGFNRPGIGWAVIYEPGKKFGDDRLPTFWILNIGVEKVLHVTPSLAVTLFVNAYNITNNSTTLKVDPLLGTSTTGQPLYILNPGIFQFGVRVSF